MVSLKKEPKIREVTTVHLIDENKAARTYCPLKEKAENSTKKLIKHADIKEHTEHTFCGLDAWEWVEIIIKSILLIGALAFVVFFLAAFLGEGLTFAKYIETVT